MQTRDRWPVEAAAIASLSVMTPLRRTQETGATARSYLKRLRDGAEGAADSLDNPRAVWRFVYGEFLEAVMPRPGESIPSSAPIAFSQGRRHWTAGKVGAAIHRQLHGAPSRHTLLRALEALVRAGALRRFDDHRTYVFLRLPTQEELGSALQLPGGDDRDNAAIAQALRGTVILADHIA